MKKLMSRKLWLTVGAVVTACCTAAAGNEPWSQALWQSVVAVMAYCGAEGYADSQHP